MASGLWQLVRRHVNRDKQLVSGAKVRIELDCFLNCCFSVRPVLLRRIDLCFDKMGAGCLGLFLELWLQAQHRSVVTLVGKIHLHELIDRVQIIGSEFRSFLERLASFVVFLLLPQDQSEREVSFR